MEKKNETTICDYLKKNLPVREYAKLVEIWEIHRGAEGEEDVYNLMDYSDFYMFANLYGLKKALECQKKNPFWFGGNNYTENSIGTMYKCAVEFPNTSESAYNIAKAMIDEEHIMERTDLYENYYDFEKYYDEVIMDKYEPNNLHSSHSLEYPLVLQHFTLLFNQNESIGSHCLKDEYCYDDLLTTIANMAYSFTELYKNTEWKTTFRDYALHYIVKYFKEFFTELYQNSNRMDVAIEYFKNFAEYYKD